MDNVVKIELDADQLEEIGIAYIKQCYETHVELLDGCEISDEDANSIKMLEGMLAYVLTKKEQAEYYADKVPYTFAAKQTSLDI